MENNIWYAVAALITGFFLMVVELLKRSKNTRVTELASGKKVKNTDPVLNLIEKNHDVELLLRALMEMLDADRILVSQFHNGEHFYTGKDMQKITVRYETVSPGISEARLSNRIPTLVSHLNWWTRESINYDFFYYNSGDISESFTRGLVESFGIRSTMCVPLVNSNNRIVGIVSINWVRNYNELFKDLTKEEFIEWVDCKLGDSLDTLANLM